MNEITSDEMKMPLCASTIGIARFNHDLLRVAADVVLRRRVAGGDADRARTET